MSSYAQFPKKLLDTVFLVRQNIQCNCVSLKSMKKTVTCMNSWYFMIFYVENYTMSINKYPLHT